MTTDNFDINVEAKIVARLAPGAKEIQFKATATSEKDLIERHVIGEFNEPESDDDAEEQPEASDL